MFFIYLFCFGQVQSEAHLWLGACYLVFVKVSKFKGWNPTHLWYSWPLLFLYDLTLRVLFIFLLQKAAQPRYFLLLLLLLFHGSQVEAETFGRSTAHFHRRCWRHWSAHGWHQVFDRVKFLPVGFRHIRLLGLTLHVELVGEVGVGGLRRF